MLAPTLFTPQQRNSASRRRESTVFLPPHYLFPPFICGVIVQLMFDHHLIIMRILGETMTQTYTPDSFSLPAAPLLQEQRRLLDIMIMVTTDRLSPGRALMGAFIL
jgi:hypothetical protein